MTEIKFKLVDGEPVCNGRCPYFIAANYHNPLDRCRISQKEIYESYSPCIPGLRQQRDKAEADLTKTKAWIRHIQYDPGSLTIHKVDSLDEILDRKGEE